MSRAQFMNDDYFEEYIFNQNKRIAKFLGLLKICDTPQKIMQCKKYLLGLYKDLLSAEYSLGKNKDRLAETFSKYLVIANEIPLPDYAEMTDALSLAVLFGSSPSECENLLNTQNFSDSLTKKLRDFIRTGKYTAEKSPLEYPENYGIFDGFLNGGISLGEFTEYMENGWYEACRELSFYDTHKSPASVYTGYWCWLAGAVLKMKGESSRAKYIPLLTSCE